MIDGNAQINSLYDYLTIFFINDKDDIEDDENNLGVCFEKIISTDYGEEMPTFNEIIELAKDRGYKKGVLRVMANSDLHGKIYTYSNHYTRINNELVPIWEESGETRGFA